MKKFLTKFFFFLAVFIVANLTVVFFADGTTDNFYEKVSTPKFNSLVVGTSRAYNGIDPAVLNDELRLDESESIYNFAFTLNNSPFGEVYYSSIKSKVDTSQSNGIFIVSVLPWSISEPKRSKMLEYDSISVLKGLSKVSGKPNFEYMLTKYSKGWGNILLKKGENFLLNKVKNELGEVSGSWTEVSPSGWLQVNTNQSESVVNEKINKNILAYNKLAGKSRYSNYRKEYLRMTVSWLSSYGKVYLIRMPIHKSLFKIESNYDADFNETIRDIISISDGYLDYSSESAEFDYTDGNHLTQASAKKMSERVVRDIDDLNSRK